MRQTGGGLCRARSAPTRIGKQRTRQTAHVEDRTHGYSPRALYADHGRDEPHEMGARLRQTIADNRKPPMAIIGALMRKLVQIAYGILKSNTLFNPALHGA